MSQRKEITITEEKRIGESVITVSPLIMSGAPVFTDTRAIGEYFDVD